MEDEEKKYVTTLSDGENEYEIMDKEAREAIPTTASTETCEAIIDELQ